MGTLEEEDEDEPPEEVEDDDQTPDPFVSEPLPAPPILGPEAIARLRQEARAQALDGEHRVLMSSPAGPGSLAEALNRLLDDGLVTAEFCDGGDDESYILYRPKA